MKQLLKKLVVVFFVILTLFCGSTVLADAVPILNYYTVVVNNPSGAKMHGMVLNNEENEYISADGNTLPYGYLFVVESTFEEDGKTYLRNGSYYVDSSDVEIYGEPVSPTDLRVKGKRQKTA